MSTLTYQETTTKRYLVCDDDGKAFDLAAMPLYGVLDPGGFSEKKLIKTGSRNAFVIGGQAPGSSRKFVVHVYAKRLKEWSVFMDDLIAAHNKWRPRHWRIECYAQQPLMLDRIRQDTIRLKAQIRSSMTISPTPSITSENAKDERIAALIPMIQRGELYLLRTMPQINDALAEIKSYPNWTKDVLDCIGWLSMLYWGGKGVDDVLKLNRARREEWLQARGQI